MRNRYSYIFRREVFWQIWLKKTAVPLLLLLCWQGVFLAAWVKPLLLPSPQTVAKTFCALAASGELVVHLQISLQRVVEEFFIAAILGISMGLALGMSSFAFSLLEGILQILRPIPPIAWLPMAILWFGIEEGSKIFIIALGSFFPVFINVLDGVRQTDARFVELAKVFEVPRWKFLVFILWPGTLPYIVAGLRIGLGYAWMCVVAAELSAGMQGIGYFLTDARALLQTDRVLAAMLSIGLIGKSMDWLLKKIEKKVSPWKEVYTGQ